jgi:hypothetical protein
MIDAQFRFNQCIPVVPVEHTRQYIVCDCETIVACSVLFTFTSANKQWMNVVLYDKPLWVIEICIQNKIKKKTILK